MIMWSHDPDTTRGGYAGSRVTLWRQWLKDLGVQFIYIDPFNLILRQAGGQVAGSPPGHRRGPL